jgi:hypothetical protein
MGAGWFQLTALAKLAVKDASSSVYIRFQLYHVNRHIALDIKL